MPAKRISSRIKKMAKHNKPTHIAKRVLVVRKQLGFTVNDVGVALGVTGAAISQAERFNRALLFEIIIFFAENYQVNPAWIIVEDNRQIPQLIERVKGITKKVTAIQDEQMDADQLATRIRRDVLRLKELVEKETTNKQKKTTRK